MSQKRTKEQEVQRRNHKNIGEALTQISKLEDKIQANFSSACTDMRWGCKGSTHLAPLSISWVLPIEVRGQLLSSL